MTHCGVCWGVYNHVDKCPVGLRLKEEIKEDARKKHLSDIEFVNQNVRYEAFLAGAASNRNAILQEAAEALEKFTGPGHPELTEVILKLRNK